MESISSETEIFSIYPNPATGILYIDLSQVLQTEDLVTMRMFSITGKKVLEQNVSPGDVTFITIKPLSAGIYLLSCTREGTPMRTEMVVVE